MTWPVDLLVLAVVAYIVPLVLAGLVLSTPRRRSAWLIGGVLAALPAFYAVHFTLFQALSGWPTAAALPDEFELLAYSVEEPDRSRGIQGQVLIWLRPSGADQPRAHRLAYERALHEALSDAGERLSEGRRQLGRTQTPEPQPERRAQDGTGTGISFSDMERRVLPPKPGRSSG